MLEDTIKKVFVMVMAALGISILAGCSDISARSSDGEFGSITISSINNDRKIETSELKISSVKVYGFEITTVSGTATNVSADGKASATVDGIPVGRRVVEVKANTGATLYAVADVKAGENNVAVNWGTTAVGAVYYELCKSQEIKDIDASEFSSAIDVTKHACLIDAAKIAADYITGSLKSSSNYVKSTVTVTAKVYGYEGKAVQIADPSSEAVTALKDGQSVQIKNVLPGTWSVFADGKKVLNVTISEENKEITIGTDPSKVVIYVKASSVPSIWVWEAAGASICELKGLTWDTQEKMTAVPAGEMNDVTGWYKYDVSDYATGKQISFILNKDNNTRTNAVCTKTFWYDGTNFYDADPTTPVLPDDNTNLKDIKVNGSSIGVVSSYEVAYKVSSVTVTAEAESEKASVTVSPSAETALTAGSSKAFTITVTAENGDTQNYTLNVTRLAKVEGDVTLESVSVNGTSIGALSGSSFTKELKGSEDSISVTVAAVANDTESASVTVTPSSATISDGADKAFTIKVTNGGNSATYTLKVSYTKQAGSQYYWTNKNGFGSYKTISSWSDWTSAEQIAQCAAYDDPRSWRGIQEVNYDVYALYAAYDDTNLYIMAELVNPVDRMTGGVGFMWHDYASSDNAWWNNRDIPLGLALNTGKASKPANGPFLDASSVIWGGATGGVRFTDSDGMDWLLYHSSKYGTFEETGAFVGVGTPGFFHVTDTGYFSYDAEYCLNVNRGSVAGFGVGVGEKNDMVTGENIAEGDILIGLSSTGVHSNGFSLVRKLVKDLNEKVTVDGKEISIGELLLTPTRIYVKPVMEVFKKYKKSIHGMVHVTGGGFYENIPRMYPKAKDGKKQLISIIKRDSWDIPAVFGELIKRGADLDSIYNTFNMGIGFVLAVKAKDADDILEMFNKNASKYHRDDCKDMVAYKIGRVAYAEGKAVTQKEQVLFED